MRIPRVRLLKIALDLLIVVARNSSLTPIAIVISLHNAMWRKRQQISFLHPNKQVAIYRSTSRASISAFPFTKLRNEYSNFVTQTEEISCA